MTIASQENDLYLDYLRQPTAEPYCDLLGQIIREPQTATAIDIAAIEITYNKLVAKCGQNAVHHTSFSRLDRAVRRLDLF